jgi:hypothetical protein
MGRRFERIFARQGQFTWSACDTTWVGRCLELVLQVMRVETVAVVR